MALAGSILVTTEQLENQAENVRGQLRVMKSNFDELKNKINASTAYWTGEAAQGHRERYLNRLGDVEEMFRRYEEHIRDLEAMAGVYREAETSVTQAAEDLPVSEL